MGMGGRLGPAAEEKRGVAKVWRKQTASAVGGRSTKRREDEGGDSESGGRARQESAVVVRVRVVKKQLLSAVR